ncbi:MAG: HAMP domain-containing sensor histidine kinase [Chloroflexota bacterium]
MTSTAPALPAAPTPRAVRLLAVLRWALPLLLCVIGLYPEISEHIATDHDAITPGLIGEVLLFSVTGPLVVFFTLSWVLRMVRAYQATADALRDANRDLEAKVDDRTRHLREATDQLASANSRLASANDELARANQQLRELDQMKSEFVSLVSHQLRAPLTNIIGALEIVSAEAAALPPSAQRTLQILALESQRLSRLIQRILDVSRLEAGRLKLHLGPVALEPLMARTAEATLGVASGAGWRIDAAPGLPPAWADEQLLAEVVRNLLENAARHAPGTDVTIDIRLAGEELELGVADHGPGVPPEEQERVFRSFHQVGDPDAVVTGHGLGLYFADRLIRAQHGAIGVTSPLVPGSDAPGARFWVRLPVAGGGPDEDDEAPWADDAEVVDAAGPDAAGPGAVGAA